MNIQANLFKIFNTVKYQALEYEKQWADALKEAKELKTDKEIAEFNERYFSTHLNAVRYAGAYDAAKLMLKTYQGEFNDKEIAEWIMILGSPEVVN